MLQISILFDLQEARLIPDSKSVSHTRIADDASFRAAALRAAKYRADVVAKTTGMSAADREDLQQDLLADMVGRARQYNPDKSCPATFTALIAKNHAADYVRSYLKDRARLIFTSGMTDQEEPEAANDIGSLFETAESAWSNAPDYYAERDTYHDLQTAIAYMNGDQKRLFDLLDGSGDLPSACKAYGSSPATFYRRVNDLQMHLRMFGLKAA